MHPQIGPKIDTEKVMKNHENVCKNDAKMGRKSMKIHAILEPAISCFLQRVLA